MQIHPHPLWSDPTRPHGPPLSDARLARFHDQVGLRLPAALIDALRGCNGGRLRRLHLPAVRPTPRFRGGLRLHGLAGVGYDEGLDWSPALIDEWGFPAPTLVLCHGGPWAALLDYRRCGPDGDPPVVFCDTDHEVAGRPAEWTVAPSFAALVEALEPLADRTRVAVPGPAERDAVLDALRSMGAEDPVREDYEGGFTLTLTGADSAEPGAARLRALPNRQLDGTWALPELPHHGWIVETTVTGPALDHHLDALQRALAPLGVAPVLLLFRAST